MKPVKDIGKKNLNSKKVFKGSGIICLTSIHLTFIFYLYRSKKQKKFLKIWLIYWFIKIEAKVYVCEGEKTTGQRVPYKNLNFFSQLSLEDWNENKYILFKQTDGAGGGR